MRNFIIFLCLIIVVASFPVPADASSYDPAQEQLGNFFDYSTTDQRYYDITSDYLPIYFNLPTEMYIGYVELFVYSSVPIDSVVCYGREAEVIRNGNNYRIIWKVGTTGSSFAFNFYFASSTTGWLYINEASFSSKITSVYDLNASISATDLISNLYSYTGDILRIPTTYRGTYDGALDFRLCINLSSTKFYDLISFSLEFVDCLSIDSISVVSDYRSVFPYSVSYIDSASDDVSTGTVLYTKIIIDLSGINWSSVNDTISVYITGSYDYNYINTDEWSPEYLCYINGIHGFVFSDNGNPVIFWFRKTYVSLGTWFNTLFDKFDDLLAGTVEDQTAADEFQDSVDEQASQFEDMSNTMNQVERPPIESIDLSVDTMVDSNSVILATNGIGTIVNNPIILRVILMALTLALAGFVLYGKR